MEDPLYMCKVAHKLVQEQEQQVSRKSQKEKQSALVGVVGKLLQVSAAVPSDVLAFCFTLGKSRGCEKIGSDFTPSIGTRFKLRLKTYFSVETNRHITIELCFKYEMCVCVRW